MLVWHLLEKVKLCDVKAKLVCNCDYNKIKRTLWTWHGLLLTFLCQLSCRRCCHCTLWLYFYSIFLINLRQWKRSKIHKSKASLKSIDLNVTTSFILFFLLKIMMLNFGSVRNAYVIDVAVIYISIHVVCTLHESIVYMEKFLSQWWRACQIRNDSILQ